MQGPTYTWTNRQQANLVREQLDHSLADPQWCSIFPNAKLLHLPAVSSNHNPLLLDTSSTSWRRNGFQVEDRWFSISGFSSTCQQLWSSIPKEGRPLYSSCRS